MYFFIALALFVIGAYIVIRLNEIQNLLIEVLSKYDTQEPVEKVNPVEHTSPNTVLSEVPIPVVAVSTPPPPSPRVTTVPEEVPQQSETFNLVKWFAEGFLLKAGATFLFFGVGWFVTYAYDQGWISPALQIAGGLMLAGVLYGLSYWRLKIDMSQGYILNALGTAIVLVTVAGAQFAYNMFPPIVAIAIMLVGIFLTLAVAMKYKKEEMAIYAAVAGFIAPHITSADEVALLSLLTYLFTFSVAIVLVVCRCGWEKTLATVFFGVLFHQVFISIDITTADELLFTVFAFLFAITWYGALVFQSTTTYRTSLVHILIHALNALFLVGWILEFVSESIQSILFFLMALIMGALTYLFVTYRHEYTFIYIHVVQAIAFFTLAVSSTFDDTSLLIVLMAESVAVMVGTVYFRSPKWLHAGSIVTSIGLMFFAIESFAAREWQNSIFHTDAFVVYTLILITAVAAYFLDCLYERGYADAYIANMVKVLGGVSGLSTIITTWLVIHALIESDGTATMITLFIYTLVGLSGYIYGARMHAPRVAWMGVALLLFVIARVLIIDIWALELFWRIFTFLGIGVALIATALLVDTSTLLRVLKEGKEEADIPSENNETSTPL